MSRLQEKLSNSIRRKNRVRKDVYGTAKRPRLSVYISNRHITAQLIDDQASSSLLGVNSANVKFRGTMTQKAEKVGEEIAKMAKAKKITKVTFDRGSRLYHGRNKALADAARKNGLEF